jgi:hypothetical protein
VCASAIWMVYNGTGICVYVHARYYAWVSAELALALCVCVCVLVRWMELCCARGLSSWARTDSCFLRNQQPSTKGSIFKTKTPRAQHRRWENGRKRSCAAGNTPLLHILSALLFAPKWCEFVCVREGAFRRMTWNLSTNAALEDLFSNNFWKINVSVTCLNAALFCLY